MDKYKMTATFSADVWATDENCAETIFLRMIRSGGVSTSNLKAEVIMNAVPSVYSFSGSNYDNKEALIEVLIEADLVVSFSQWMVETYDSYDVVMGTKTYQDYCQEYEDYVNDAISTLMMVGTIKIKE